MEKLGIRELRQNASKYIDRVKKGESFEVTERGVPVAVLSPALAAPVSLYERLVAEGKLIPAQGDLREWLRENPPSKMRDENGRSVSEILQEMRDEERY